MQNSKNRNKTNRNWSGGRPGVIWGVYVKLKKHKKTGVKKDEEKDDSKEEKKVAKKE